MLERAGSYVSENKYLISLYIFRNIFSGLAEKTVSGKSFHFNRLEFLAYDPALSGIRPLSACIVGWIYPCLLALTWCAYLIWKYRRAFCSSAYAPFLFRVTSVRVSVSVSVPDSDTLTDTVGQKTTRRRVKDYMPEGMRLHAGGYETTCRRV